MDCRIHSKSGVKDKRKNYISRNKYNFFFKKKIQANSSDKEKVGSIPVN